MVSDTRNALMDAPPPYVIQLDALYFQPLENGVSYAIEQQKVKNPDFNYHWGARGKVGANLCHDCWQLWLQFLHYHAREKRAQNAAVFPTWGHPSLNQNALADGAFNLWRLHLGLLDLGLSRSWIVSPCLELKLLGGLRYDEVRHKLKVEYFGVEEVLSMKNKFWGVGPEMGVEMLYGFNHWLGVFSRGVFHLAFGKFYLHQDQMQAGLKVKLLDEFWIIEGILDGALGLDFRISFRCVQLFTRIAWEAYIFFGQNQLVRFVDQTMPAQFVANQGDLSLQGLSLSFGVEF